MYLSTHTIHKYQEPDIRCNSCYTAIGIMYSKARMSADSANVQFAPHICIPCVQWLFKHVGVGVRIVGQNFEMALSLYRDFGYDMHLTAQTLNYSLKGLGSMLLNTPHHHHHHHHHPFHQYILGCAVYCIGSFFFSFFSKFLSLTVNGGISLTQSLPLSPSPLSLSLSHTHTHTHSHSHTHNRIL